MVAQQRSGLTLAVLLASACGQEDRAPAPEAGPPPDPEPSETAIPQRDMDPLVYVCPDGTRYTVLIDDEAALLLLPDRARRLAHVPAASGARYAEGEDVFWSKGEEALFIVDGTQYAGCVNDRMAAIWEAARIRGVDYRAVGNEPGWHVEIERQGVTRYVGDYGSTTIEFPTPAPQRDEAAGTVRYAGSGDGKDIAITLETRRCQDTMVDVEYPLTVTVDVDGRRLRGCGRALGVPDEPAATSTD